MSSQYLIGASLLLCIGYITFFPRDISEGPVGEISKISEELVVHWKIKKFFTSLSREFSSSSFSFVNESWHIALHPNEEGDKYIGAYLHRELPGPPIRLEFSFSLKTMDETKYLERHVSFLFENQQTFHMQKLISRNELFKRESSIMPSGVLTVIFSLRHPAPTEYTRSSEVPFQSKILQDFKELYIKREDSDITIKVKEKNFPAHRIILKARAPVFLSTFENDLNWKRHGIANIKDCDTETFEKFLRFLYWGYVSDISSENVFSLFAVADKYGVLDLRTTCLEFMKANLSINTFVETIILAVNHSEKELINLTTDFFIKNAQNIISTDKWRSLITTYPILGNELFQKLMATDTGSKA